MTEEVRRQMIDRARSVTLRASDAAIELMRIEPGDFIMGSPPNEAGRSTNDVPARRVQISRPYYLGRYPITQAQYRAVIGSLPKQVFGDDLPVSQLCYRDALELCRRLATSTGLGVSLPTEAQWEHACRAGTETPYWSGTTEDELARVGWYRGNAGGRAHAVGEKPANAWGLHDMHGNVWELCSDFFPDPSKVGAIDPVGERTNDRGAMRGGGWMHGPADCRAARRMLSDDMFGGAGLRIALDAG